MAGEKTEKATPKRKKDERKKGNVFLSQEVVTIFTLLATFYSLKFIMPSIMRSLEESIKYFSSLASSMSSLTYGELSKIFVSLMILFAKAAAVPLLVCGAAAIVATMFQTKMLFSAKAFSFKGERINPMKGLKKIFSMRSFVELLKSLLKISIVLYVIYTVVKSELFLMPQMMHMTFDQSLIKTGSIIMSIVTKAGIAFIFVAGADYLYQWWQYEKNLRMSKQEIKDEYKQTEGDPQIKGRIRSMQQQRAKRRMMQSVPTADVVIKNPTHYAIAIKYDQDKNIAPRVVAKGVDSLALRIIAVAEENNVYVMENKPLARALFESVDLDREIPERFYKAVAEVLAFVYSLKKKELK
ncbi:MAG: flagellar biosynthesis protein FlhB [Oscillospiraceae bacterium]